MILSEVSNPFMSFLVAVPGAGRKVKVIYNLARVEDQEGLCDTDLVENVLALTGELLPGAQLPRALVLPDKALEAKSTKVPDGEDFNWKRLDPSLTKATWFTIAKVEKGCDLPSVIPVPMFLIYNSVDGEIDLMVVYEHWMVFCTSQKFHPFEKTSALLRAFLKAQVVSPTTHEMQTRLESKVFVKTPPEIVNQWKSNALQELFPMEFKAPTLSNQPMPPVNHHNKEDAEDSSDNKADQQCTQTKTKSIIKKPTLFHQEAT